MEKAKEQNTPFLNLSKILTIVSILAAIIAAIFFAEDRYNLKSEYDSLDNRVEAINNKVEAIRIKIMININHQNLESAQKLLNLFKKGKDNKELYKYYSKKEVIEGLNTLPNKIKEIEIRIDELIKKDMEYAPLF